MRNFNDFALKYCRVLFYLTIFCCFLFTPALADTQFRWWQPGTCGEQYNNYAWTHVLGGSGSASDPYMIHSDRYYQHQLSQGYGSMGGLTNQPFTNSKDDCPTTMGYLFHMTTQGSGYMYVNGQGTIVVYVTCDNSYEPLITPTPTPTMNWTDGGNTTPVNWTTISPTIIPTFPPWYQPTTNSSNITQQLNTSLIPAEVVRAYVAFWDWLISIFYNIFQTLLNILLWIITWITSIISNILKLFEDVINQIYTYLMPIQMLMHYVFGAIPDGVVMVITFALVLDLVWQVLSWRK